MFSCEDDNVFNANMFVSDFVSLTYVKLHGICCLDIPIFLSGAI